MEEDDDDTSINAIKQETRIRVAMDSGSCRNSRILVPSPQVLR